jgi:hypothetical protein
LSNDILARIVVTIVVMTAFTFWLAIEKAQTAHCQKDCPTDISASQR